MTAEIVRGFTTGRVCELAGVAPSTLNSWAAGADPLVTPSIIGSAGKRADRFWSVRDLIVVRAIKALRGAGCPMQQLRFASRRIAEVWDSDLDQVVLYWDGRDIIATDTWGEVTSLIRHPGQLMLQVVVLPLDSWREESERQAREVPVTEILERRRRRATLSA